MAQEASLDQLVALSDEIAALVRADVPLEAGLRSLGADFPGEMGRIAARLGERMEGGESLVQAIDAEGDRFPPVYRAVVRAGVRSGSLASAIEGLAEVGRRMGDVRRSACLAIIYPIIFTTVAFVCLLFLLLFVAPAMQSGMSDLGFGGSIEPLGQPSGASWPLAWLVLSVIAFVSLVIFWWRFSKRGLGGVGKLKGTSRWPVFARRMVGWWRAAAFADLLALLLEHKTPLDEAVVLAAEGSGDSGLAASMRTAAEKIRLGDPAPFDSPQDVYAPLLLWRVAVSARAAAAPQALRSVADDYRARALDSYNSFRVALPIALVFFIGFPLVCGYALCIFLPWSRFVAYLTGPEFT